MTYIREILPPVQEVHEILNDKGLGIKRLGHLNTVVPRLHCMDLGLHQHFSMRLCGMILN